jgi:acetyl esterase/lipase
MDSAQMVSQKCLTVFAAVIVLAAFVVSSRGEDVRPSIKNVVFQESGPRKLLLDIYNPQSPPPASGYPLIVYLHGGAWEYGTRHEAVLLRKLTNEGYAIAGLDYRLSSEAKFPAQIDDVRQGVQWLVANAAAYHFDTNRIFAAGLSAGGHLSLLLGLSQKPGDRTIKAVCAFYPPTDLVAIIPLVGRGRTDNPVADLLGGSVMSKMALAKEASPMTYIRKDSVPSLIFHGDEDTLVPLSQSTSLDAAMKTVGASCTVVVRKGEGHAFLPDDKMLSQIAKFFESAVKN